VVFFEARSLRVRAAFFAARLLAFFFSARVRAAFLAARLRFREVVLRLVALRLRGLNFGVVRLRRTLVAFFFRLTTRFRFGLALALN
jgi:hypothetical protein